MYKIINFFKHAFSFIDFLIDSIINIAKTLWAILIFIGTAFNALPLMVKIILIGIVAFSIAYKLLSLGGAGGE